MLSLLMATFFLFAFPGADHAQSADDLTPLRVAIMGDAAPLLEGDRLILDITHLAGDSISIEAEDPNFPELGIQQYKGVPLAEIVWRFGGGSYDDVTVISTDQYAVHLSAEDLQTRKPILAFQVNGEPIPNRYGGPLKLMFPQKTGNNLHMYAWYVTNLVIGQVKTPTIRVSCQGNRSILTWADLSRMPHASLRHAFPLPRGVRLHLPLLRREVDVDGIWLSEFMAKCPNNHTRVVFHPLVGKPITLPLEDNKPIPVLVATSLMGLPIHPAYGGPLCGLFVLDKRPDMVRLAPPTGSIFFLEEIEFE